MASVFRATDTLLGRAVAIKLFPTDPADTDDILRRQEEVQLLASLNHPALVTLFDAGEETTPGAGPRAFLVMELVEGPDLRHRLHQGALLPSEVGLIGADICDALAYTHGRGVVHRDVKPANILLPSRGTGTGTGTRAKLADFGIARLIDGARMTGTGAVIGTASYLSPEQAVGGAVTGASDVYSLGLVLVEALTGERAFPGSAVSAVAARLNRDPDLPEHVGDAWRILLRAMTARNPEDRPSAADAGASLRALVAEGAELSDPTVRLPVVGAPSSPLSSDAAIARARASLPAPPASPADIDTAAMQPTQATAAPEPEHDTLTFDAVKTPSRRSRRRRTVAVIAAAAVLLGGLAAGAAVLLAPPAPTRTLVTNYPVVDGDLGSDLRDLQEAVQP
jgi:serine/threonine protein kinase